MYEQRVQTIEAREDLLACYKSGLCDLMAVQYDSVKRALQGGGGVIALARSRIGPSRLSLILPGAFS